MDDKKPKVKIVSFPVKHEDPLLKHIEIETAKLRTKKRAKGLRSLCRRGAGLATRRGEL